jgi:hypothetical protein
MPGDPVGFLEFWSAYPVKPDRADAVKAWRELKPDRALREMIMMGLDRWKRSRQWQEGAIPYAAKFLRKRRWEAEPPGGKDREAAMAEWIASGAAKGSTTE